MTKARQNPITYDFSPNELAELFHPDDLAIIHQALEYLESERGRARELQIEITRLRREFGRVLNEIQPNQGNDDE